MAATVSIYLLGLLLINPFSLTFINWPFARFVIRYAPLWLKKPPWVLVTAVATNIVFNWVLFALFFVSAKSLLGAPPGFRFLFAPLVSIILSERAWIHLPVVVNYLPQYQDFLNKPGTLPPGTVAFDKLVSLAVFEMGIRGLLFAFFAVIFCPEF